MTTGKTMKINKPKRISLYDGSAECVSESMILDEAFGVQVDGFLYDSKSVRRLIKFLQKALNWIEHKEKYLGKGVR